MTYLQIQQMQMKRLASAAKTLKRSDWVRGQDHELIRVGDYHGGMTKVLPLHIESMARLFNEEQKGNPADRPPLILGHPSFFGDDGEGPRFGEYVEIRAEGEGDSLQLFGTVEAVPEAVEMMDSGQWPGRSIGFFEDGEDTGRYMLDHVAMLGQNRPGVPGLAPMQFSAKAGREVFRLTTAGKAARSVGDDTTTSATGQNKPETGENEMKPESLFGKLAAKFASLWGVDTKEAATKLAEDPADEKTLAALEAVGLDDEAPEPESQPEDGDDLAARVAELEAENAALKEQIETASAEEPEGEEAEAELSARISKAVKAGRISKASGEKLARMDPTAAAVVLELAEKPARREKMRQALGGSDGRDESGQSDAEIFERKFGRKPLAGDAGKAEIDNMRTLYPGLFGAAGDVQGHA